MSRTRAQAFPRVADACTAFRDGCIGEDQLVRAVVAFPHVKEAPLPDAPWFDAITRNHGPISEMEDAHGSGLVVGQVYERVVSAMLDAGHEA